MLIKSLAYLIKLALVVKNIDLVLRDRMIHRYIYIFSVAEVRVQRWEWVGFIAVSKFIVTFFLLVFT